MSKVLFDFKDGSVAEYIENLIDERIRFTNGGYFQSEVFEYTKVKLDGEYYISSKGQDKFIVFAYLKNFYTKKHETFPKFHVTDCETRKNYSNYSFANSMPVDIHCLDEHKIYKQKHLLMCKNCQKKIRNNHFGLGNIKWFDAVLEFADKEIFTEADRNKFGYVFLWKQISEAKRTKVNYICENCKINLSNYRKFLEVHHIDKDTLNNKSKNLKALCVKCHSIHHPNNYNNGNNLLKLNEFKEISNKSYHQ